MAWKLVILCIIFLVILLWGYAIIAGIRRSWSHLLGNRKLGILPSLVIGNITVGGTGKTPFILFVSELLSENRISVLSRGYGRESKGYLEVESHSNSKKVGDEPLEIKRTLAKAGLHAKVVVGENRLLAIEKIARDNSEIDFVILDDGLQHVNLIPDVSVVLTTFEKPFNRELFSLPLGNLREFVQSAREYDFLVVTKCPSNLTSKEIEEWWRTNSSGLHFSRENVFFAEYRIESEILNSFEIGKVGHGEFKSTLEVKGESCLLITGIVNPIGIQLHLEETGFQVKKHFSYSDHYYFGLEDIKEWLKYSMDAGVYCWFTTRKDWQRLQDILKENKEIIPKEFSLKVGIVFTRVHILEGRKEEFKNKIVDKLKENKR